MTRTRWSLAPFALALSLAGLTSPAEAQKKDAAIGPHLGVNFDVDDLLLGGHARFDVANIGSSVMVQVYPNLSYYFIDPGDLDLFNIALDVPFEFVVSGSVLRPYVAPGLAILWATWDYGPGGDDSDVDLGLDIIGGLLFELGVAEPWFELRLIAGAGLDAEIRGGVQFVL